MTIYIKYKDGIPANINFYSARSGFDLIGETVVPFEEISSITLEKNDIVIGYISDVIEAFKKLNYKIPELIDYPPELKEFLGRKIWTSTIKEIRKNEQYPIFIKPKIKHKLFDGYIRAGFIYDDRNINGLDGCEKIWVSEYIEIISEWRNFVYEGYLVDSKCYLGDFKKVIDYDVVECAIKEYKSSNVAYSIDFGLDKTGRTILIECNDVISLGSYGLNSVLYAKIIRDRWKEISFE